MEEAKVNGGLSVGEHERDLGVWVWGGVLGSGSLAGGVWKGACGPYTVGGPRGWGRGSEPLMVADEFADDDADADECLNITNIHSIKQDRTASLKHTKVVGDV